MPWTARECSLGRPRPELLDRFGDFESFDQRLADHAASIQHMLLARGKRLGWHDLQVATTAIHHGEPLVSRDEVFEEVPDLELYRW